MKQRDDQIEVKAMRLQKQYNSDVYPSKPGTYQTGTQNIFSMPTHYTRRKKSSRLENSCTNEDSYRNSEQPEVGNSQGKIGHNIFQNSHGGVVGADDECCSDKMTPDVTKAQLVHVVSQNSSSK